MECPSRVLVAFQLMRALSPVSGGRLDVAGQNCKHRPRAECSWPMRRPCGPGGMGFIEVGQGLG